MKKLEKMRGITLVALVVTIILLLILAGISIQLIGGSNGVLNRASQALDANDKATATEKMELKITYLNMVSYGENTRKATLQELADGLFADKEVEYVKLKNQEVATLQPIDVTGESSFFVKLKEYSYEFEIDENLQLASVDGVKVATTDEENSELKAKIEELEKNMATMQNTLNANNEMIKNLEKAPLNSDVLFTGTATLGDYTIADISEYKYLVIYMNFLYQGARIRLSPAVISVSSIVYNNSDTLKDDTLFTFVNRSGSAPYSFVDYYFKTPTKICIRETGSYGEYSNPSIFRIEGIK